MTTATRRKEQTKPVTGTVRWLRSLIIGKQLGRVRITNANGLAVEYGIDAFTDKDGAIQGFGLAKDNDEIYTIDVTGWFGWLCDCADYQFRDRECKHIKAVHAALEQAGLSVPVPKRQESVREPMEFDDP